MQVWVMRHGEAGFNATTDSQRSLTEKGKKMAFAQGQWLAKRLVRQGISLDKILVSPYLRTQQTLAELLSGMQAVGGLQSFANLSDKVEVWDGITPSGVVDKVLNYLDFLRAEGMQNALIISHLPLVYDLVQGLTDYQHSVQFYPAVMAEIEWRVNNVQLVTTAYPEM